MSEPHPSSLIPHLFPSLYPLTDRGITGLTHAEQIKRLADGGARLVQLRDKHAGAGELLAAAREAVAVARARGVRVIVNDRADVALAAGADGVHLGQDDLPADAARRLLGDDAIIGVSTHNAEQAARAALLPVSYVAIGPVFATTTKQNPDPVIGLDAVRRVRDLLPARLPLVAIGGITAENARATIEAGADAVAVVGALLAAPDEIDRRTRELLARLG